MGAAKNVFSGTVCPTKYIVPQRKNTDITSRFMTNGEIIVIKKHNLLKPYHLKILVGLMAVRAAILSSLHEQVSQIANRKKGQ
jgi:hypothetical protein